MSFHSISASISSVSLLKSVFLSECTGVSARSCFRLHPAPKSGMGVRSRSRQEMVCFLLDERHCTARPDLKDLGHSPGFRRFTNEFLTHRDCARRQSSLRIVTEGIARQKGDGVAVRGNPFPRPLGVQGDKQIRRGAAESRTKRETPAKAGVEAVSEGFEPPVRSPAHLFSRQAPSTTRTTHPFT